jgi:membrane protein implicated in regulation of membrane protease activity
MIAAGFLILLGAYLAIGLVFAVPFALVGAKKIDPHAAKGSWGFRLLIIPGATALWPLLLRRWVAGVKEPPEECNAHRRAARKGGAL